MKPLKSEMIDYFRIQDKTPDRKIRGTKYTITELRKMKKDDLFYFYKKHERKDHERKEHDDREYTEGKLNLKRDPESTKKTLTMPKGRYFIGDPSYVFSVKQWQQIADLMWNKPVRKEELSLFLNGKRIIIGPTSGDGIYADQYGNKYAVDSALIGAVPESLVNHKLLHDLRPLYMFKNFDHPWKFKWGMKEMRFGDIRIDLD